MNILQELAQGLGPSLRSAGGVYSPQVFQANEQRYQQSQLLDARRKENAFSVLVNAIESGAIDPAAGQAAIERLGFDVGQIGPSTRAQFWNVQTKEQQRVLDLEKQADLEEQRVTKEYDDQLRRIDEQDQSVQQDIQAAEPLPEVRPAPPQLEFDEQPIPGVENRPPGPEPMPAGTKPGGVQMQPTPVDPETTSREQLRYAIEVNRRLAQSTNPVARKRGLERLMQLQKLMAEQQEKAPKPINIKVGEETWSIVKDPGKSIKERLPSDESYGVLSKGKTGSLVTINDRRETEFERKYGGGMGDVAAKAVGDLDRAENRIATLDQALQSFKEWQEAGGSTGALANVQVAAIRLAQAFGFRPEDLGLPSTAGPAEVIRSLTQKMALENIGGPDGMPANNFSDADREFVTSINSQLPDTPDGFLMKLLIGKKVAERNADITRSMMQALDSGMTYTQWRLKVAPEFRGKPLYTAQEKREMLANARRAKAATPKEGQSRRVLPGLTEEETAEHDRLIRELQ